MPNQWVSMSGDANEQLIILPGPNNIYKHLTVTVDSVQWVRVQGPPFVDILHLISLTT